MKKEIDLRAISVIALSLLVGFVMLYMIVSMVRFSDETTGQQTQSIVEIIQKAAVQCYALEGEYPPNVEYLRDNYGVIMDEGKYFYYYDAALGSSIMPDITVIAKD